MKNSIRTLQPQSLWNHFSDLNAVPRPSKKEDRIISFMVDFAKNLNLETIVDEVHALLCFKIANSIDM